MVNASVMNELNKYNRPAQLDQQQKNSTQFVDSSTNPTGESGVVIFKQI